LIRLVGCAPFLLVHLPITVLAASIGVWLFYVQHQFEDTSWSYDVAVDQQRLAYLLPTLVPQATEPLLPWALEGLQVAGLATMQGGNR